MKLNKRLLPIKFHFFFFMAASGPILPYLTVYGKQLGISEVIMGSITAGVPITFLLAKPIFGFLADYYYEKRKLIFMALITSTSLFYLGLYFIPPVNIDMEYSKIENNFSVFHLCDDMPMGPDYILNSLTNELCNITCPTDIPTSSCQIIAFNSTQGVCYKFSTPKYCKSPEIRQECLEKCLMQSSKERRIFLSFEFYGFIFLMTLSMIAFNVSNSISDAICFDLLEDEGDKKYGHQRVWGAIGFGITAFLGGFGMDFWSTGKTKNYTPAFITVIIFTIIDIICCRKLKLPKLTSNESILKDLSKVLQNKNISIFLIFATLLGILDGFIIYFLFWYLEDLAMNADMTKHIKILEGLTVAAETLGGEIIFFLLSGKILKILGYGNTLSLCFLNYALRMFLISTISNPWWIVAVELFMQGPTYALCYTTIVAYANAISPPGASATMQGIVAGMDDGFGYALGSLIGGFLYKGVGGTLAFQIFSLVAVCCSIAHMIIYKTHLSKIYSKDLSKEYRSPDVALKTVQSETNRR